jgi:hypothetical protein
MKIPVWILTIAVGALVALQGWTLQTVFDLSKDVAGIKATIAAQTYPPSPPVSSQPGKVAANNP